MSDQGSARRMMKAWLVVALTVAAGLAVWANSSDTRSLENVGQDPPKDGGAGVGTRDGPGDLIPPQAPLRPNFIGADVPVPAPPVPQIAEGSLPVLDPSAGFPAVAYEPAVEIIDTGTRNGAFPDDLVTSNDAYLTYTEQNMALPNGDNYPYAEVTAPESPCGGTFPSSNQASDNNYRCYREKDVGSTPTDARFPTTNSGAGTNCGSPADGGDWSTPNNAHQDGGGVATAAPGKDKNFCSLWNGFGYSIPTTASISGVSVKIKYSVSTTASIATLHVGPRTTNGPTSCAVQEDGSEPTSLTVKTFSFATCKSWTPADFNTNAFQVSIAAHRGGSSTAVTFNLDYVQVEVLWHNPLFQLSLLYQWNGIPAGATTYTLKIEGYHTAGEDFVVQVLTPPSTWNTRFTISKTSDDNSDQTHVLTPSEFNGGAPQVQILGTQESSDTTQNDLFIDHVRFSRTYAPNYALDVRHDWSGIPPSANPYALEIEAFRTDEDISVQVLDPSTGTWNLRLTIAATADPNSDLAYELTGQELNGGAPSIRYRGTTEIGDTAQSNLKIDRVRMVGIDPGQTRLPTPPRPDLLVEDLSSAPEYAVWGEPVTLEFTVRNQGAVRVDSVTVVLYDVPGSGPLSLLGFRVVPLNAWEGAGSLVWPNPAPGTHNVLAMADGFLEVEESNEANNNHSLAMSVGVPGQTIPDLVVSTIEIDGHAHANETVGVNVTVRNIGSATTSAFAVTVYDASSEQTIGTYQQSALAPLASGLSSVAWTPEVVDISHIRVTVDSGSAVTEKNEWNNEGALSVPVDPDPDCGPGAEGCHPECDIVIIGDWEIDTVVTYLARLICVVDGNVNINGPEGSLTLDSSGLKFKDWTNPGLYGLFVNSGGTLITSRDPAAPSDWPYPKIFSTSSNDVFTFVAQAGSVLDIQDTKVDWLSGPAPNLSLYPGGLWIRTSSVTATRLSIREPQHHGLYIQDNIVIPNPLVDLEVLDPGFGGSGGTGVVLGPGSQIQLSGGSIQSATSGEDGVVVLSSARLVASDFAVSGFPRYGIALDVKAPATVAGSISLGGSSLIEGRVDASGIGTSTAAIRISKADPNQPTMIQGVTIRNVRVGIIIEQSSPPQGGVVVGGSIIDVSTPTPASGYKGIDVFQSTVTLIDNLVGPQTVGARSIATGLLLTQASGTISGNFVYRVREPVNSGRSPAGIDVVDSTSSLSVSGGTVADFDSGTAYVASCGIRISKTAAGAWNPEVDRVAISGTDPGANHAQIGICVLPGTNPTLLGPGRATPGPHISRVRAGVLIDQATATIDGVRIEKDAWTSIFDAFYGGICMISTTATVTIQNVFIKDGLNPGIEVGGCGNEDNPSQAGTAVVSNSYIGHDPARRYGTYGGSFHDPSNYGIWVGHGSSVDILGNTLVEYNDVHQVRIENPGPGLIEIRDSSFRDIVDSCAPLVRGNTQCNPDRGLVILYGADTMASGDDAIVANNVFLDGIWGLSIDPDPGDTFKTTTVSVLDNLFRNQRFVGLGGCGQESWGGGDDCVGVVRGNEFTQQRSHAMVLSRSSWTVERNNLHENEGDGSDGNPSGAVYLNANAVIFRENSVLNTVGVGAAGVGVKVRGSSPASIQDNRFEGNDVALLLISTGAYSVTNRPSVPVCQTTSLSYCGFRGNGLGIMVQGFSPRPGASIAFNEVDGLGVSTSMGIVFWEIDQDYTYLGDAFGNKVINTGFGIVQRYPHIDVPGNPPVLVPYTLTITGLTDHALLSGNGYGIWVDNNAKAVVQGNNIFENGWAVGTRQSTTVVRLNEIRNQVEGAVRVEGASPWGLARVDSNFIHSLYNPTCPAPPASPGVIGIFIASYAGSDPNPFLYGNNIQYVCHGIYTFNSNSGVNLMEGVHDNLILSTDQGITIEGNSQSTFRQNWIWGVRWGYAVKGAQPTIKDHAGLMPVGYMSGIQEFTEVGVYVTGTTAAPIVSNNDIWTSTLTANGVWADKVSTQSTWVTGNTITLTGTGACSGEPCFAGVRVSESSNVQVEGNTLSGAAVLGGQDDLRTGLLVCSRVDGTGSCVPGPGPFADPVILRDNAVTDFWQGVWLHDAVRVQVGGPAPADGNFVSGVLRYGLVEAGGATWGSVIEVTYNEVTTSLPATQGTSGLRVTTGTYGHNWVHDLYYPAVVIIDAPTATVTMEYNVVENSYGVGIGASGSGALFLHGNTVRNTGLDGAGGPAAGIRITSLPSARVTCNVIQTNLAYGLALESASGVQVYRNAFLTNTLSPQGYDDAATPNAWDNGAVGNYWTDWNNNNPGWPAYYEVAPLGPPTAKDTFPLGTNPTGPGCTA